MAYDAARRRVVMHGGAAPLGRLSDLWEWDGTTWIERTPSTGPPKRSEHALAYDAARGRMLLYGGTDTVRLGDTWLFGPAVVGPEACAHGLDADEDGLHACDDEDCWGTCRPHCPPGTSCAQSGPGCEDGTCSSLESCGVCPADCGACPAVCGNFLCEAPDETSGNCPGDC